MTANVVKYKEAPASMRSRMDTIAVTARTITGWSLPSFQRPLKVNDKVRGLARDNQSVEAIALSAGRGRQLVGEQEKQIKEYIDLQRQFMAQAKEAAASQYDNTRALLVGATVIGLSERIALFLAAAPHSNFFQISHAADGVNLRLGLKAAANHGQRCRVRGREKIRGVA